VIHLHSFHLYNSKYDILNILPLSNLRILSIVIFENSDQISKITYLRISNCPLEQLINVTNLTLSYEIIMKKSCLLFC